jgi:hypothetical protein
LPAGFVSDSSDCDDTNPAIHPGATEICNGLDDDCNGAADDGLPVATYYADADQDTYGNPNVAITYCDQPAGYVTDSTDCDDTNPNVNPGVLEVSNNGIDDNCNGAIDEFGVGMSEVVTNSYFSIFPNPAYEEITLQLQTNSSGVVLISVVNVYGEITLEQSFPLVNGNLNEKISLDEKFAGGMYCVKIQSDHQQWLKPLLVIR